MSEMEKMRDRVLQLEQILGIDSSETGRIREAFGLEPDLARIMGMLLKRNFVSHESLYTVMYGHRPECEWPDAKVLDVQICKLRRRLKPFAIVIVTRWGEGWSISVANKVKARAVLDPAGVGTPRKPAAGGWRFWKAHRALSTAQILLPPKLVPVFTGEAMFRGAYGGRGSAKTRSFAKMTAVRALMWAAAGIRESSSAAASS
jgi:hypothetical protein